MFMDNMTTVVLIAPVTILIAEILGISPIPLLMAEALLSDTGGVATERKAQGDEQGIEQFDHVGGQRNRLGAQPLHPGLGR